MNLTKPKLNLDKNYFYTLLIMIALLTFVSVLVILAPFTIGVRQDQFINQTNKDDLSKIGKELALTKIFSYVSNQLILVGFAIYIVLLRHKLKAGFGFFFISILIFVAMAFTPYVRGVSYMSDVEYAFSILLSILCGLVTLILSSLAIKLFLKRKIWHYEKYKIHKQRR
ncbi:hypothetical protein V2E24_01655 [Mycoplasmopsis ciconiae]|uniref:Uncharacterized protein n=1 Tax=Mycoplasmopsis ciconiae TaxID=561067 RepID=A0ABU7MMS0_9BACT|nr:hypothetical protein [Mycoplasmopsis ciconiae]